MNYADYKIEFIKALKQYIMNEVRAGKYKENDVLPSESSFTFDLNATFDIWNEDIKDFEILFNKINVKRGII